MLAYKITGNTSYSCKEITAEEAKDYPAPQWYVSETPINWTTHRIVNGVIEEIPPTPPDPPPTKEELQRQAIDTLNYEVFPKTRQIKELYASAYLGVDLKNSDGTLKTQEAIDIEVKARRDFLKVQYDALRDDTLAKQEAILHG